MENPFKKILHNEEVPKILRERVINDISMIKLSIDVADLFVIKFPGIAGSLLTLTDDNEKQKKVN